MTMNVDEVLSRVRNRIHDRDGATFQDPEVLTQIDDSLRKLSPSLRIEGDEHGLDAYDVPVGSLTLQQTNVYGYTVPEYVGDIQLIEVVNSSGRTLPVPKITLEEIADHQSPYWGRNKPQFVWHWGPRKSIVLRGPLGGWVAVRISYVSAFPPVFIISPVSGSSTSVPTSGATISGNLKNRDNLYLGCELEVVSGPTAANIGQYRTITAFAGGTFTCAAFPSSISGHRLALLLPIPDEHADYLAWLVAEALLLRAGSTEYLEACQAKIAELRSDFDMAISRRSSGEPVRFHSSRLRT